MLCVSEMAEAIRPDRLSQMLENHSIAPEVIIIDCRPLLVMNTCRIVGANDVHCPPIVKRRSGGNIPLENILRNPQKREAFLTRRFSCIVLYDDNTRCLKGLAKDSNMHLVIKTLKEERGVEDLYFLHGGFQQFQMSCPHLCTSPMATTVTTTTSSMPSSTSSMCLDTTTHHAHSHHSNHTLLREPSRCYSNRDKDGPVEVFPWLYIGNLHHALQVENLLQMGVTTLINMAASTETSPLPSPHFCYKNIPVRDSCSADILQWFPEVIDFIEGVRRKRGKVLVHCQAGISRSATVCIAYLMFYKGMDLDQAFDFLKAKRTVISPNLNFMRQLTEFQVQLKEGTSRIRQRSSGPVSPKLTLGLLDGHSCTGTNNALGLALTPCVQQAAAAFAFDAPSFGASAVSTCSPPTMPLQSPLMSPS